MWRPSLKLTNTAKFLSPGFLAGLDLQHLRQASVNICHVQVLAFGGVRWHSLAFVGMREQEMSQQPVSLFAVLAEEPQISNDITAIWKQCFKAGGGGS